MKNEIIEMIDQMREKALDGKLDMQSLKDYFSDLETLVDAAEETTSNEFTIGQEVYCNVTHKNVFIKDIGEISYFCVEDKEDKQGFYYSKCDLKEI